MRFWHYLRHGMFGTFAVFALVMLSIVSIPVFAQDPTATPEPAWDATTEATAPAWDATEESAAASPLTLVWQTSFTRETALPSPGDIAIDTDGNVYVSTQSSNGVKKFDSNGNLVTEWGGGGEEPGHFSLSLGIDVDADNNVYVTDFYHSRIQKFDSNGTFLLEWETNQSTSPAFLAVDHQGNLYIDLFPPHDDHFIQKFDTEGNLLSEWGKASGEFAGRIEDIAVDKDGNLYVADPLMRRIQKLDPEGNLLATFGGEASKEGNGLFFDPFGVSVDNDGYIYVLDGNFLQKLDWEGNFVTQWSTDGGDLDKAANVAVDGDGNIYVFARADVTAFNGNQVNVLVLKKFQQSGW